MNPEQMKFVTDPAQIARARQLILHEPDLNILRPTTEGHYAALVQQIEASFKQRNADVKLLLPDLRALNNSSVGIFSDYSGEGVGNYNIYSFLICAFDARGAFLAEMKKLRAAFGLGAKEIAFKHFDTGQLRRALPAYFDALDNYVPGFLFTLVVDKKIRSIFGPSDKVSREERERTLREFGYKGVKPKTIEKMLRVTHIAAYLTALLAHQGQKLFWMSDHDAICANEEMHHSLLTVFQNVLGLYTTKTFPLLGGAMPFKDRDTDYLDLLSATDVTAGALNQYFTEGDLVGEQNAQVKEGAEQVLLWLCHDAFGLKKLSLQMHLDADGRLVSGPINFTPKIIREGARFLPFELCR